MKRDRPKATGITWAYGKLYVLDRDQYWIHGVSEAVARRLHTVCGTEQGGEQPNTGEERVTVLASVSLFKFQHNTRVGSLMWLPVCDKREGEPTRAALVGGHVHRIYRSDRVDTVIDKLVHACRLREQRLGMGATCQPARSVELSPQERCVIRLIGHGLTQGTIARVLGIHQKTVSTHKCNAMRKLGLRRTLDLFHWLQLSGLLKLKR